MIRTPFLAGHKVAVMGLGKSGTATARALAASGAQVSVWDDAEAQRAMAAAEGLAVADPAGTPVTEFSAIMWSPGIPHTWPKPHPVAQAAFKAGVPVICDIELLNVAHPLATYCGITGTNGKSTTTTLLAHVLDRLGRIIQVGGNLGTPALQLEPLDQGGTYVLELSSYQLELINQAGFDIGILLNITPDHLARHGGMDGYIAAKARLFGQLKPGGYAIIGQDDEHCRAVTDSLRRDGEWVIGFSAEMPVAGGVYVIDGQLIDDLDGDRKTVLDLTGIKTLPGRHNWQNAAAVYAAARALGHDAAAIAESMKSYPGLAHRQELVGVVDGISYVNDSKATNADAAEKALVCYDHAYWIIGGQAKEGGIDSLAPLFGRVAHAFLIGEAAPAFAATLDKHGVAYTQCGELAVAVQAATAMARTDGHKDAVVLLSPACASWDQFKSFEHRGDSFRALVADLKGKA